MNALIRFPLILSFTNSNKYFFRVKPQIVCTGYVLFLRPPPFGSSNYLHMVECRVLTIAVKQVVLSARTSFALLTTEFVPQTRTICAVELLYGINARNGTLPEPRLRTMEFISKLSVSLARATDEKFRVFTKTRN